MKYFTFIVFLILPIIIYSQRESDGTRRKDNYIIIRPCVVYPYDLSKTKIKDTVNTLIAQRNFFCKFIQEDNDGNWIIEFWDENFYVDPNADKLKKESPEYKHRAVEALQFIGDPNNNNYKNYFLIKRVDVENKLIKWYSTLLFKDLFNLKNQRRFFDGTSITTGVLAIPFKIRPQLNFIDSTSQDFEFSSGISLGTTIGLRHRISHTYPSYINLLLYTGLSSVSINNSNSEIDDEDPRNEAAFTIAWGIMMDVNNIQVGLIMGWDLIANQSKVKWTYYNKPWFSLGFGVQLFSIGD